MGWETGFFYVEFFKKSGFKKNLVQTFFGHTPHTPPIKEGRLFFVKLDKESNPYHIILTNVNEISAALYLFILVYLF